MKGNDPIPDSKCPKCQSGQLNPAEWDDLELSYLHYECGTRSNSRGEVLESLECLRNRLAAVTAERDEWREDRDHFLKREIPWMEMVEAVYPDHEYDFGEALSMIIKDRDKYKAGCEERDRVLDEVGGFLWGLADREAKSRRVNAATASEAIRGYSRKCRILSTRPQKGE